MEISENTYLEKVQKGFEMWWEKFENLRNKFCRETHLIGYEKEDLEQECYFIFRQAVVDFDESLGFTFGTYYRAKLYGWRANMNRKIKLREVVLLQDETIYGDANAIEMEDRVIGKILCEKIKTLLSDKDYELIYRYYIKQESLKVVAEYLNLTYRSAERRKKKILDELRVMI